MATVTVKVQNQTKPEKRFTDALVAKENARRTADKLNTLPQLADIEAYYVESLSRDIAAGGKDYDVAQADTDADFKALRAAWADLTNTQRTAVKAAAGIQ